MRTSVSSYDPPDRERPNPSSHGRAARRIPLNADVVCASRTHTPNCLGRARRHLIAPAHTLLAQEGGEKPPPPARLPAHQPPAHPPSSMPAALVTSDSVPSGRVVPERSLGGATAGQAMRNAAVCQVSSHVRIQQTGRGIQHRQVDPWRDPVGVGAFISRKSLGVR